jgi:hypothetical protein
MKIVCLFLIFSFTITLANKESDFIFPRVKYSGGGDWYNDPSSDVNLLKFIQQNTNIIVNPKYHFVDLATDDIFKYPVVWLTGHGNISFTKKEIQNLRAFLENGGFLYIDDDYGLDPYIRKEIKKVFPDKDFIELPFSHKIYTSHFDFSKGLPKIHEHDKQNPQGFGMFINGRLAIYYTYECNLGDGWADPSVHNDPQEVRENALKMGTNIIVYALSN